MTIRDFFAFAELPSHEVGVSSNWINDDVRPLHPTRRTWTGATFLTWWSIWQLSLTSFQLGASLVAIGLSVWQVMIAVIIGRTLTAATAVYCGMPGAEWHIGWPVFCRLVWGVWGSYIPVIIRLFLVLTGFAVQTFVGGLCVTAILGAIFPSFQNMQSSIPASEDVTTQQIVGWIVFNVIAAVLLYIRPEKSKPAVLILSIVSFATMLGITIWALAQAHGGGPLLSAPSQATAGAELGWTFLSGIQIVIGGTVIATMGQADFSRFARSPGDQVLGQWFSFCVIGVVTPLLGCLTASATLAIYDQPIWNPPVLTLTWLSTDYSATSRAGAFFVGLGLVCSQLGITMVDNGYSAGMDLAGIFPRYINIRRGSYTILILSLVLFPWKIVSSAQIFVGVISGFVIFVVPICGCQVAEYFIARHRKIKLSDLYHQNAEGVYYYTGGVNWRTLISWCVGFVPCVPGMAAAINPAVRLEAGAVDFFQIAWLYGFVVALILQCGLNFAFPPKGLKEVDADDRFGTFDESTFEEDGVRGVIGVETVMSSGKQER